MAEATVFQIKTKSDAKAFYKNRKKDILIPYNAPDSTVYLRFESEQYVSFVCERDLLNGYAATMPRIYDADGSVAFKYRQHINAYLSSRR